MRLQVRSSGFSDYAWSHCAREHAHPTCRCNGVVRYGHGNRWYMKEVSGSIQCSNSVFGDPYYGKPKECQCMPASAIKWTRCAGEHSHSPCSCNGVVRYGRGTRWHMKEVSGSTQCSNSVFGDPFYGQAHGINSTCARKIGACAYVRILSPLLTCLGPTAGQGMPMHGSQGGRD